MAESPSIDCVHHWLLETPDDEVVRGRCKRCGAEREYPASVEGLNRWGTLEEAAAVSKSIELLPDADQGSVGRGASVPATAW
jgi:hypothetical protein